MKDTTRRLLLFVIITTVGSLLIILDFPPLALIGGVGLLGIMILFLTGAVTAADVKGAFKRRPKKEPKVKKIKEPGKKASKPEKGGSDTSGGVFSRMHQGFSLLFHNLKKGRSAKRATAAAGTAGSTHPGEKGAAGGGVSSLLDMTPEVTPLSRKSEPDPFLSIGDEPLDADLLANILPDDGGPLLDDIDPLADNPSGTLGSTALSSVDNLEISLDSEEQTINIDEEGDYEVNAILEAHKADLLEDGGMPTPDDLGGAFPDMGEVDLGSLDLNGIELGGPAPASKPSSPVPGGSGPGPASPKAATIGGINPGGGAAPDFSQPPAEEQMLGFATGGRGDDDLMAALKMEAKGTKKKENLSLLRELKDTRVSVSDLEEEILSLLGGNKSKGSSNERK